MVHPHTRPTYSSLQACSPPSFPARCPALAHARKTRNIFTNPKSRNIFFRGQLACGTRCSVVSNFPMSDVTNYGSGPPDARGAFNDMCLKLRVLSVLITVGTLYLRTSTQTGERANASRKHISVASPLTTRRSLKLLFRQVPKRIISKSLPKNPSSAAWLGKKN